jgi:diketogulonate reductase-like aldo/keto reductase
MIDLRTYPKLIYGTAWKKELTTNLVIQALKLGFNAIDTASQPRHYREDLVGEGIKKSGIKREEIFIQTKFTPQNGQDLKSIPYNPNDKIEKQIEDSFIVSKKNLQTEYIDSYILHSPLSTLEETLAVWRVMESFVDKKDVKYLGISNCYDLALFRRIFDHATIKPTFLQNRFYADSNYDTHIREFCEANGVIYQSFWTLTANPHILNTTIIKELSNKYLKTPAQIFFRYCTMIGIIPLIGATNKEHLESDLKIFEFTLDNEEILEIKRLLSI